MPESIAVGELEIQILAMREEIQALSQGIQEIKQALTLPAKPKNAPDDSEWFPTKIAARKLKIHPETLRRFKRDRLLKFGYHYRVAGLGACSENCQYHWERIASDVLAVVPSKRKRYRN